MLSFQCPHCHGVMSAGPEWAGREAACAHCGGRLSVPGPPAQTPTPWIPAQTAMAPAAALSLSVQVKSASKPRGSGCNGKVLPQGLWLTKRNQPIGMIPVGTPSEHVGGAKIATSLDGERVEVVVFKFARYHHRIARHLAAFLRGEAPVPGAGAYWVEWYIMVLAALPAGMLFLTVGDILWGGLIGGAAGAVGALNMGVLQYEAWPLPGRIVVVAFLTAVAYGTAIGLGAAPYGAG